MGTEMPVTVVACDGCGKDLNVLVPYLHVQIKAQRNALISEDAVSDNPEEDGGANIYLGTRAGRGRLLKLHNFDCLNEYAHERKGQAAKIEVHHGEDDPVYDSADAPAEEGEK